MTGRTREQRDRRAERQRRYRAGRFSELLAAAYLLGKGFRVLARRYRAPSGEVDLIVRRGRRLSFVEVKRRPTLADGEAAITARQLERVLRAGEHWLATRPALRELDRSIDVIIVCPWRLPHHVENVYAR